MIETWDDELEVIKAEWKQEWEDHLNEIHMCFLNSWTRQAKHNLLDMEDLATLLFRIGETQYMNGLRTLAKRVAEMDTEDSILVVKITGEGSE